MGILGQKVLHQYFRIILEELPKYRFPFPSLEEIFNIRPYFLTKIALANLHIPSYQ